jgi:hypothetical protein
MACAYWGYCFRYWSFVCHIFESRFLYVWAGSYIACGGICLVHTCNHVVRTVHCMFVDIVYLPFPCGSGLLWIFTCFLFRTYVFFCVLFHIYIYVYFRMPSHWGVACVHVLFAFPCGGWLVFDQTCIDIGILFFFKYIFQKVLFLFKYSVVFVCISRLYSCFF